MTVRTPARESELAALLISPDRELAESFLATVPQVKGFQILADLRSYPTLQTLEMRLRQLQPEIVFVDLGSDFAQAGEVIQYLSNLRPAVHVVGLYAKNDADIILRAVRAGASEFMYQPFEAGLQQEVVSRLRKLRRPAAAAEVNSGKVLVFSSAKPGAGASTLAVQTAFALKRSTGRKVLLVDLDLAGGTIGFFLKLNQNRSIADALNTADLDVSKWSDFTVSCGGIDILTAPESPHLDAVEITRLQDVLQFARFLYDWIVVDAPSIFNSISQHALAESDRTFLITTSELPSLHLTRKAISMLTQSGVSKDQFQVIVNRASKKDGLGGGDLGKLFECSVQASFPNDYFSLHRVITLGRPLSNDCALGKAIEQMAAKIAGASPADKKNTGEAASEIPPHSQRPPVEQPVAAESK
ncbi:MAG: AAA family ATPase [Candidatus Solibacter usitatus]|nr:AAA family ATPase [Candidatus Solibacter usitatus]